MFSIEAVKKRCHFSHVYLLFHSDAFFYNNRSRVKVTIADRDSYIDEGMIPHKESKIKEEQPKCELALFKI